MISVKSSFYGPDKWLAFPGFLCSLFMIMDRPPICLLINKPGLEYCISVVETNSLNENLSYYGKAKYPLLSKIQFRRYTFFSAGTQGKLNRKLSFRGVYRRSIRNDGLDKLRWVSAKFRWSSGGFIKFMESPILLFDSSCVDTLVQDWCSAFTSFLMFGFLDINISYNSFYLGRTRLEFCNLLGD